MMKSLGAQRESDGVVVPLRVVERNAAGGKGPEFGRAGRGATRKGMAGTARPDSPDRPGGPVDPDRCPPVGGVRGLQRKRWAAARQSPERRFHALDDRVGRGGVLRAAWGRVRAHRGAAGVDRWTLGQVEVCGVKRLLAGLRQDLRQGRYRPAPARRVDSPKADGRLRPLGIPTASAYCRVVQYAL